MTDHVDEDGVVHDRVACPGDDWIGCHDGVIYGPCGHPNCYGADEAQSACTCKCHEAVSP